MSKTALARMPKTKLLETARKFGMGELEDKITKPALLTLFDAYLDQRFAKPVNTRNAGSLTVTEIASSILRCARAWFTDTSLVVIEQQMRSRMHVVVACLAMWFLERGIPCRTISACKKLECLGKVEGGYRGRKVAAVGLTKEKLAHHGIAPQWVTLFERHPKKDDLADAFLYAELTVTGAK